MLCTLSSDLIPAAHVPTPKLTGDIVYKPENPDLLRVYDLENSGWRSFRISTLLDVEAV